MSITDKLPQEHYWANEPSDLELIHNCVVIRDAFQSLQRQSGCVEKAYRNWRLYLGINERGQSGRVIHDQQRELARLSVNHLRANSRIILQYTTAQDPTWACQAANDSHGAEQAVKTAERLLGYYWEQERVAQFARMVAEYALVFRSAFLLGEWDETAGKAIGVLDEAKKLLVYEGQMRFSPFTPWQVVFDPYAPTPWDWKWVMWGELFNRWDLAEVYWDRRDKIRTVRLARGDRFYGMEEGLVDSKVHEDLIWRWTLVHLPTPACEQGRFLRWVGDEIPLVGGRCPDYYARGNNGKGRLPVHRLVHSETPGATISGHTPLDDGAPLQEALNAQMSTILTNHMKFGRWKYKGRYGDSINLMDLPDADLVQTEGDLEVLAPPGSADLVGMAENYIKQMGQVMGVAEASRGAAPTNETAALSLALQDSSTVTNNRAFDQNYRGLLQDVASGIVEILQVVVDDKRKVAVLGENNVSEVVEFNKDILEPVTGVLVRPASPMLRLNSGRIGFLEGIVAKFPNLVSNEHEILNAIETGNFRGVFKSRDNELALAKSENERMRAGEKIVPQAHEHQVLHIQTHSEELSGPQAWADPDYRTRLLTHISYHVQLLANPANQALQVLLGHMKLPELQAYQIALGIGAGLPVPPPPEAGGSPAEAPPGPEAPAGGDPGNVDDAKAKLGEAGEALKQGTEASPMSQAGMQ